MASNLDAVQAAAEALQAGDYRQAEALCRDVLSRDPAQLECLLTLGLVDQQRGRLDDAERWFHRAVQARPESADAFALHGQALRALGRREQALQAWDAAVALQATADVLFNQGNLLREMDRESEAVDCYDRALAASGEDAAILNNRGVALHTLGRHEEALDSFARALRLRPGYAQAFNNRGNALLALGRHDLALASFDRALQLAPGDPQASLNRGNVLLAQQRPAEALASFDAVIAAAPAHGEAHRHRAAALLQLGRLPEALRSSLEAVRLQPGSSAAQATRAQVLSAMGRHEEALDGHRRAFELEAGAGTATGIADALHALGRGQEAVTYYEAALAIDGDLPHAWNNRGNALQALDRPEDALASYERAIALRPQDAQAHWNEALVRLTLGDYERGWPKYEWRWQNARLDLPPQPDAARKWRGTEPLAGRSILLYTEQGFGDAIQFIRFAPVLAARGARVHVACHESLVDLFRTVHGVEAVHADGDTPHFDLHAALMSLPLALDIRLDSIPARVPYVHAQDRAAQQWRERLETVEGLKVGVAWSGNPRFEGAHEKRCPVELMARLASVPGTRLVSLQLGADAAQACLLGADALDFTRELDSFAATAALIESLDIVVTVDTAVAHLAGALGKPVWIVLPFAADWRWLRKRSDSPWYPSARLFRQASRGAWEPVIEALKVRLDEAARTWLGDSAAQREEA